MSEPRKKFSEQFFIFVLGLSKKFGDEVRMGTGTLLVCEIPNLSNVHSKGMGEWVDTMHNNALLIYCIVR